jgi:IS5 family transposase
MENRNGLVVAMTVTAATGTAEREAALDMLDAAVPGTRRITLAADKGYDTREFVAACRERRVTPHIARKKSSTIDERTARHPGYALSQKVRKRVEEIWGWMKTIGGFRKTRFRGRERTELAAQLVASAYNLLRIAKLVAA